MKLTQLLAAVLFSVMCLSAIAADETVTITIDKPQTAVLDPANWTTVYANEKYFDAFENIWGFVNKHMIHPTLGEFRILLSREGQPIDANLGNPWKVAYHTGRALLECSQRISRLLT